MRNTLATLVLPSMLALLVATPASAQVRLGLDIGAVSIRIAPDAPPPPRVEVRMHRPDRRHVWIRGSWDRRDNQWMWAPGRWERPAQRGSTWVRPRYRQEGDGWRYEPAHWSHQRLVEGDDYREWREKRGHGRGRGHDEGRGNNKHRRRN